MAGCSRFVLAVLAAAGTLPALGDSLGVTAITVGSAAGSSSVMLTVSQITSWTASSDSNWLHLNTSGGSNNALITFTYDANFQVAPRTGVLTIDNLRLAVTQAGINYAALSSITTLISSGLNQPNGIAVDPSGNLYIADLNNKAIEKWNASTQQLTTLVPGLNQPYGVALDTQENVYFVDAGNNALYEWVAASQTVTTLVSTGLSQPTGLAVDFFGQVYIANTGFGNIIKYIFGGTNVEVCCLTQPSGVAVDALLNLYITDPANGVIKKKPPNSPLTNLVTGLNHPYGVAVDGQDNVYIADSGDNAIKEWVAATAQVLTLPSSGLNGPTGVTVDSLGNVYIADTYNNAVKRANSAWAVLGTSSITVGSPAANSTVELAVTQTPASWSAISNAAWLHITQGSASGAGNALIQFSYDANNISTPRTGTLTIAGLTLSVTQAGNNYVAVSPVSTLASLSGPYGIRSDQLGNVYMSDNNAIYEWNALNQQLTTVVNPGQHFWYGVAPDGQGNVYFPYQGGIGKWISANQQLVTVVSNLNSPRGLALDGQGNVYIANFGLAAPSPIQKWTASTGLLTTLVSSGLANPEDVVVDVQGNVYIADTENSLIKKWSPANQQVTTLASGIRAFGIAVDGQGNVYISDINNNAVREWSAATQQVSTLLSSGLYGNCGVAVDPQGNVYVADFSNGVVKKITIGFLALSANSKTEGAPAGTDSVTAQVLPIGTPLTAASDQSWLTITGIANGVIGFSFTTNGTGAARVAHISVLGQQVTVTQTVPIPPTADSVTPSAGAGTPQVFTLKYSSVNGFGYLNDVYALFKDSVKGVNACFALYDKAASGFYLYNDAGSGLMGPLAPGAGTSLSNSQCTLSGTGSSVSGSGNTLTVVMNLGFNASFAGTQNIFLYAADSGGMASGWQNRGTWTVPGGNTPPTADSVNPASGSALTQAFTFKYSSANGFGYLNDVYALFKNSINGVNACFALYDKAANGFYLYNDAGTGLTGPLAPGAGTSLSNSQCTLSGTGSSVSGSGNTLTVIMNLTFNASFAGVQSIFLYAADHGGLASGWQNRGTWTVPAGNTPPTADSVSPASGSGLTQAFTFKYSSVNGFGYLNDVYALFRNSFNGANACFALYDKAATGFYLYNDAGSGITGPLAPGAGTSLSNGQCTLSGTGSSVSGSGNTLTVVMNLTFNTSFSGTQNIYMYAADGGGMASGWQNRGTWTVPAGNTPPTADSVNPSSGSGQTQAFTFKYSSVNGFGYLNDVYALFKNSINGVNACFALYDKAANGFYLYNDAGSGLTGPLAPGAGTSLSNSQCTLSGTGSSVSGSGNTLTVVMNLTFNVSFAGAQNIFMYAADGGGMASGWQNRGTWTVP